MLFQIQPQKYAFFSKQTTFSRVLSPSVSNILVVFAFLMIKETNNLVIMKTRNLLLTAALLLSAATAGAQEEVGTWSIIPRIGVNLANISKMDLWYIDEGQETKLKSKYKAGMKVGVDVDYQLTRSLSTSLGVYYSMLGNRYSDYTEKKVTSTSPRTVNCTDYSEFVIDHQYITVPLMAHYYLAKGFAVSAGVQIGFSVKGTMKQYLKSYTVINDEINRESIKEESYKFDDDENMNKVDFSIPVGLSYEYENVIIAARYDIGVSKVYKTGNSKNKVFEFTVGYRFAL